MAKEAVFRCNEGCQPYLYTCYILLEGHAPIKVCEDAQFTELIGALSFLIDPFYMDYISDARFAAILYRITQDRNYSFCVRVPDEEEFLKFAQLSVTGTRGE